MKIKSEQTKMRNTIAKQSQLSSLNNSMIKLFKHDSKHTKLSTNFTSNSLHQNGQNKKHIKQKSQVIQIDHIKQKNNKQKDKTIRQPFKDKANQQKKIKSKTKNKKSCNFQISKISNPENGAISYRQYCLVENSFVPITSKNQQKKLECIMKSTADTTHRFQDFSRSTFRKVFPFKIKNNSINNSNFSQDFILPLKNQNQINDLLQQKFIPSPTFQQIGIQYSERPCFKQKQQQLKISEKFIQNEVNNKQQEQQKIKKLIQFGIQTQYLQQKQIQSPVNNLYDFSPKQTVQQNQNQHLTLSDLLLTLEFKYFPNQKAFSNLSKIQKQHYLELFQSLACKMSQNQILSDSSKDKNHKQLESNLHFKSKQQIFVQQIAFAPFQEIKLKYQKLQHEIKQRQCHQMNFKYFQTPNQLKNFEIDTTLNSVTIFLNNFFCYLQINYLQYLLNNIQIKYGLPYSQQYILITNKKSRKYEITQNRDSLQVLDPQIFEDFCSLFDDLTQFQENYFKAIFDNINQRLNQYRPFYRHLNEPFPWVIQPYNNVAQYVIDEQQIPYVLNSVKQSIQRDASFLCGLIIDQTYYKDIEEINPLSIKREQKQDILIKSWLYQRTDQFYVRQCQATKIFHDVSQEIYKALLIQFLNQIPGNISSI